MVRHRLGRAFLSGCTSQTTLTGRRAFSSSATCFKVPVPTFTQTSSPELDGLLQKFRDRLFIPTWLSLADKKLLFRQSKAADLEKNPVVVNVGTKEMVDNYTLRPMKITDLPTTAELSTALKLLKTEEDWRNVIPLLTGFHSAKRPITQPIMEMIIRLAGEQGMEGIVLQAASQSRVTGLYLSNPDIARTLLFAIRQKVQKANFTGPDIHLAIKQARAALQLMEAPEHTNATPANDPKRLPSVLGMMLELKAAYALDKPGAHDRDWGIRSLGRAIVNTWHLENLTVPCSWSEGNWVLRTYIPLWHGLDLALKVEEVKADTVLQQKLERNKAELAKAIEGTIELVERERAQLTHMVEWSKSVYQ
ncbi:hypothetical protein FQN49_005964 [Arthroderma sp. PD_2]|nr:hypothetical protein FQN49_005964 [Arthroderma sp. PD_2]